MEIAAQTKILMEMPEKIWSHVEAGQMVIAALLYLQARNLLYNLLYLLYFYNRKLNVEGIESTSILYLFEVIFLFKMVKDGLINARLTGAFKCVI